MKVGVIGAGLIGGSIILALCDRNYELAVVTRNQKTIEELKKHNIYASDDMQLLKNCDVVFVCTPMNKTLETLDKLEKILSENTIVADVSSLKSFVMNKKRPYKLIGSHPMAGTENTGFHSAYKELFSGAKWVLTPAPDINESEISILEEIIKATGAKTLIMDAKSHDLCAALISHMPMLISQALMKSVMSENDALQLAASGFRDMTRLSMSNPEMADDMIKMNRDNVKVALKSLIQATVELLDNDYRQEIENIRAFRQNMYDEKGCNIL